MQIVYSRIRRANLCVSALNSGVTMERLDRIYVCTRCNEVFLFKSDVEDHREMSGHDDVKSEPF